MALARAATRGVGDAWGTAEDAATAVQWLHRQGLDGMTALADLLTARDGRTVDDWVPRLEDPVDGRVAGYARWPPAPPWPTAARR